MIKNLTTTAAPTDIPPEEEWDEVDRAGHFAARKVFEQYGLDRLFVALTAGHNPSALNRYDDPDLPGITPETAVITIDPRGNHVAAEGDAEAVDEDFVTVAYAKGCDAETKALAAGKPASVTFIVTAEQYGQLIVAVINNARKAGNFAAVRQASA